MTIKKIALFSAIGCMSFFSIANANATADALYDAYQGQYVSVNVGAAYANDIFYNRRSDSGFLGVGSDLFLGDQVGPYFAPEIVLDFFDLPPLGTASALGLDGKFTLPMNDRVSLFARVGGAVGYIQTRVSGRNRTSNGLVPTFGLGAGYGLGHRWMLTAELNGAYFPKSTVNGNGLFGAATIGATRFFY